MASTLSYYCSKCRLANAIIAEFPPHRCYVEACAGSAAVMMAKPPSKVEVLNDIDSELVNYYRVLRDNEKALVRLLKLTPYSREEHAVARRSFADPSLDPVERARRYVVATCQSYSGLVADGFSRSKARPVAQTFANRVDGLHAVAERLRHVTIEHLGAEELIAKNDAEDTLFYVDPPYNPTVRTASDREAGKYRHEMSLDDHAGLLTALNAAKGKVLLSGYDSPLYERMLRGWRVCWRASVQQVSATALKNRAGAWRTEVLWANFAAR